MAKHQNLGPGGVPLHNTPREQGLSLFKTLCITVERCGGTWGIVLTEAICLLITGVTLYSQSWGDGGTRTRTSSSSAGTSTTG